MINLLPPDYRLTMKYARRNTVLRHWVLGLSYGLIGVVAIVIAGHIYIQQSISSYEHAIAETNTNLTEQKRDETIKRVQDISNSLNLSVKVLSREVLFSKLLKQIGTIMPPGTVLEDLSLKSDLAGAIDIKAGAISYETATQVQVNLRDTANKIFQKADLVDVSCDSPVVDEDEEPDPYPCQTVLRALFVKDNPYLFLNEGNE